MNDSSIYGYRKGEFMFLAEVCEERFMAFANAVTCLIAYGEFHEKYFLYEKCHK